MRRLLIPLVILAILAGFLAWWFSATEVVKRRTRDLMEVLTLDAATPAGTRNLASFKLDGLLAQQIEFKKPSMADLDGHHDRSEISQGFAALCSTARETRLKVRNFESIAAADGKATVTALLEVHIDLKGPQSADETGKAVLHWVKTDEGWRLEGVDWTPDQKK